MLIYDFLYCLDEIRKDKVCLVFGASLLTYGELRRRVDGLACRLGLFQGEKVLVQMENPLEQLVFLLAIARAGGVAVLVDVNFPESVCQQLMQGHGIERKIDEQFVLLGGGKNVLPLVRKEDIFLGVLSSGSTGLPKIVWRDHVSWTSSFKVQSELFGLGEGSRLFLVGGLSYSANLNACVQMLSTGGTVVLGFGKQPKMWLEQMKVNVVDSIFMVPANLRMLVRYVKEVCAGVASIFSGGAKLDRDTVLLLLKYFPNAHVSEYYGASELGFVSYASAKDILSRPLSVGKAFPNVQIVIENDVVWIASPYLVLARQPRASAGDLGFLDSEGYLFLLGRENDVINVAGVKVLPENIRQVVLRCPSVCDVAIVGVADFLRGQKVFAFVVAKDASLRASDVLQFCHKNAPKFNCPHKVLFVERLPLNANGKVNRLKLVELSASVL